MSNIDKLNKLLEACFMEDLNDPTKCTPGLYQVVRGYINDNREQLETIPEESLQFLEEKLNDSIPFRKEA